MTQNTNQFGFRTILKGFLSAFNMERGLMPTLRDLLLRPGKVVNYYIEENKEKYFSPGRFFVTAFAIYAIYILLFPSMEPNTNNSSINNKYISSILTFLDNNPMVAYAFIVIPVNAIVSRFSFYTYGLNLAKHFVIHVYCMCFLLIMDGLLIMVFDLLFQDEMNKLIVNEVLPSGRPLQIRFKIFLYAIASSLVQIIYYAFALKQIFQIRAYHAILKSLLLVFGFFIFFILMGIGGGILTVYFTHH